MYQLTPSCLALPNSWSRPGVSAANHGLKGNDQARHLVIVGAGYARFLHFFKVSAAGTGTFPKAKFHRPHVGSPQIVPVLTPTPTMINPIGDACPGYVRTVNFDKLSSPGYVDWLFSLHLGRVETGNPVDGLENRHTPRDGLPYRLRLCNPPGLGGAWSPR